MRTPAYAGAAALACRAMLRSRWSPPALLILLVMLLLGLAMWAVNPIFWIWLIATRSETQAVSLGQIGLILVGIVATALALVWILSQLQGFYARFTRQDAEVMLRMPWTKSMRDGRAAGRPTTMLDIIMVTSVGLALISFVLWFTFIYDAGAGRGG